MKKVISLLVIALCFIGLESKAQVKWPFGAPSTVTFTASGTTVLAINNTMNYCSSIVTTTAAATLDVTVNSQIKAGAILHLQCTTTGSESMTFSGAIIAPPITGSAGSTWSQCFIYNGTKFYPCGAKIQVN